MASTTQHTTLEDDPLRAEEQVTSPNADTGVVSTESEAVDALSVLFRVDCGAIRDENDAPVAIFQQQSVKMDVAIDRSLVIGYETSLYLAQPPKEASNAEDKASTALVLLEDEAKTTLEDDELIADVKWIGGDHFGVGYTSGIFRVFTREGKLLLEQKFHHAAILKVDVSASVSTKPSGNILGRTDPSASVSASDSDGPTPDGEIWILHDDSTVAIVQVQELLQRIRALSYGPTQVGKFRKYALRDQADITTALSCGPARPTIFQSHSRLGVHTVVSVGADPFISFYHAGNDQNSIIHLAHIATAIASRAAGAVWSFAKSWGWSGSVAADGTEGAAEVRSIDEAAEHVAAPLSSVRSFPEDQRRRSRMLVLCPTGRLAAVSDTLGRIMLIDTYRMTIIRMWKGYRYAQVGWMHGVEGKRRSRGLYLVIYSAQRGIVEVWRARYGPRVYSFAIGDSARLFTRYDMQQQRIRCMVLTGGADGLTDMIEVHADAPSASILMKYFTQNKLQEENFLLHQIIGGIQAFVKKKRVDASHTLEQDSVNPLLDDIGQLSSPTSIQSLVDVLLAQDMAFLSASFVLRALEQLQSVLRNGLASHSPSGTELSLLWQLQWRQRVLSAFIGLHTEYHRSKHIIAHAMKDSSTMLAKHVTNDVEIDSARSRLVPWLELYRRAGYNWNDESHESIRQASVRAGQLTWWDFMECFSMPFSDPELPRRRDILALYERTDKSEDFIREAFRALGVPILRTSVRGAPFFALLTFLYTPVLSNVFAVQELQSLHESLFLSPGDFTSMFLEWYFSLPVGAILAIPPPSLSSSFQRWLQPSISTWDFEQDLDQDGHDDLVHSNKRRLSSCPESLGQIYRACIRSQRLVHVFVLSEHCRWGEQQKSKSFEETTLGKFSSIDGGLRWSILQDCLAQAVHLSLRLGRLGRIAVETVENVDDIMRSIALMQLNEGQDLDDLDLGAKPTIEGSTSQDQESNKQDAWVASLEDSRNATQMKSWAAVLKWYPQFADADSLYCFRASLLCAAWNAERSDMHQLEDAVVELQAISSTRLKLAMGVHVWEKYIRVHVVTLITFWEESAAGRKPPRGLQPQIARRFFGIIKNLLTTLHTAVDGSVFIQDEANHNSLDPDAEEDDEEDDEEDEQEDDDDEASNENTHAAFTMSSLTQRRRWNCRVRHLREAFRMKWPPSHEHASLIQSLRSFSVDQVSRHQISDHLSLILLLDSFAATSVTPVSIVRLFANKGRHLCRPETFTSTHQETTSAEKKMIHKERTHFLRQLLRYDETLGFALAEAFELPTEQIREEYVLFLYQCGSDEVADFSLDKMKRPERIVSQLGSIARARLALILSRMKTDPEFAMVMSVLPADLFAWIVAEKSPPLVADAQVAKLDEAPSLTATSMLLLKCLGLMQPTGPEFEKISAMSVLVKDVIARVKHQQQFTRPG
ncbi:hypothetical protein Poli38472_005401 [Pythium oligandrum]|uniref:Rab3-GAP regulatory subunit N-terminal domain-containing protein n=1 Tax=Pythium oligandrum TaxID=41045 RepID=A0A8K1CHW8_PYTOL|nr:hypothetical protein Poli38472_005401 [Pythium oligandrum]|eukprot:TMW62783.1 hypothetical protein Poli38472_005401 [Pythium oligandrum]